jgi:hypothetical protein
MLTHPFARLPGSPRYAMRAPRLRLKGCVDPSQIAEVHARERSFARDFTIELAVRRYIVTQGYEEGNGDRLRLVKGSVPVPRGAKSELPPFWPQAPQ